MKNLYLFLFLLIGLSACTDSSTTDFNTDAELRSAGDGLFDVLGYGYDVTGEYLHPKSVKFKVLDIAKYNKDYPGRIDSGTPSWGSDHVYYGYSAMDYISDITKDSNAELKIKNEEKGFAGNIKGNSYLKSEFSYSSKNSFASVDAVRNRKYLRINDELSRLKNYLSPEFLEDLNRLTADRVVEKYGTHVLIDLTIGGRYKLMYKSTIFTSKDATTKKNTVSAGLDFVLKKIAFNLSADRTITVNETLAKENHAKELYVMFYGGNGTNLKYDLEKGMPSTVDVASWENAVKLDNATLTNINWKETYPIYDFISDVNKKAQIQAAVERYIANNQLKELEVEPLHRYWNRNYLMFYPTSIYGESHIGSDWKYEGVIGYVNKVQLPGTVALHRYYNKKYTMFYLTSIFGESHIGSDWKYEGIVGYVNKTQIEGTVALHRYYNKKYTMFYFTSVYGESRMGGDWQYEGVIGYVYPSDIPCVDTDKYPNLTPW